LLTPPPIALQGIVATLDEEGIKPGEKSDELWLKNMATVIGKHEHLKLSSSPSDKTIARNAFMLKHYAGDVTYTIDGFLDKNTDTLFKDLGRFVLSQHCQMLHEICPSHAAPQCTHACTRTPANVHEKPCRARPSHVVMSPQSDFKRG
jgi:myosin-1